MVRFFAFLLPSLTSPISILWERRGLKTEWMGLIGVIGVGSYVQERGCADGEGGVEDDAAVMKGGSSGAWEGDPVVRVEGSV